jgi:AbrB family looped-hinge helix DNA binding protein
VGWRYIWDYKHMWHNRAMITPLSSVTDETLYVIALGARGRIVLPARLRERLGLVEGDRVVLRERADGVLEFVSLRQQAGKLRGVFKDVGSADSLVDELLADRRVAARHEDEP